MKDNLDIRAPEVKKIIGFSPSWLVQWGSTFLFLFIIILLAIGFIIKYPDTISGNAVITTTVPPYTVKSKINGIVSNILVSEKDMVSPNQEIAIINNTLDHDAITFLSNLIEKDVDNLAPKDFISEYTFGFLQKDFNDFQELITLSVNNPEIKIITQRIANERRQISTYSEMLKLQREQEIILQDEVSNGAERLEMTTTLYKSGTISRAEYLNEKEKYNQKRLNLNNLGISNLQLEITLNEKRTQLSNYQNELSKTNNRFYQDYQRITNNIASYINEWKFSYEIKSPISGSIYFPDTLFTGMDLIAGQDIFTVVPNNLEYVARGYFAPSGFGKVKVGQQVRIRLSNYPEYEFGIIYGQIISINPVLQEGKYLVDIILPDSLVTNYNVKIPYNPNMTGKVEVITEDLRLIDRVFHSLRKVLKHQ